MMTSTETAHTAARRRGRDVALWVHQGLLGLMLGAVATHLFVLGDSPALPAVLLVLTAVLAWARHDRTTALLRQLRGEPT